MPRIEQLTKLREQNPADPDIPYMLAQEYAKAGETDRAIEAYDACIALDPDYHYAYFHKARAQEAEGEETAAADTLRAGLARAQAAGHAKAVSEIAAYLDSIT